MQQDDCLSLVRWFNRTLLKMDVRVWGVGKVGKFLHTVSPSPHLVNLPYLFTCIPTNAMKSNAYLAVAVDPP